MAAASRKTSGLAFGLDQRGGRAFQRRMDMARDAAQRDRQTARLDKIDGERQRLVDREASRLRALQQRDPNLAQAIMDAART